MSLLIRSVLCMVLVLLAGPAWSEDGEQGPRPWVNKPSAALAAKFRNWRLQYEKSERPESPSEGTFRWRADGPAALGRLVGPGSARRIKLTPVDQAVSLQPEQAASGKDTRPVTVEMMSAFQSRDVERLVKREHLNDGRLDPVKHFNGASVQAFDGALRVPGKKERVWSINWYVESVGDENPAGYEAWGLFTRVGGVLKPFHLVGRRTNFEAPMSPTYLVLAAGDLDGDGLDELVVRAWEFEAEDDAMLLWAFERGAPATLSRIR